MNLLLFEIGNLRINDNFLLKQINSTKEDNIYVFIWDSKWDDKSNNFINMGPFKKRFLKESIINLKDNLEKINLNLNIFYGNKYEILSDIIEKNNVKNIYKNKSISDYDKLIEINITTQFKINIIHPQLKHNYLSNNEFKTISNNKSIKLKNNININNIDIPYCSNNILGGETSATNYLNNFIKKEHILKNNNNINFYFLINNWLSFGCITNKIVYKNIYPIYLKNKNNKYLTNYIKDIIQKEYYLLNFDKINLNIQNNNTLNGSVTTINKLFKSETGYPYIDSIIKEINSTGRTHIKNKFIIASFIVNDLNLNWKIGFDYFNSLLTDLNHQLNLQIWDYIINKNIYFNSKKQFLELDPNCKYVKKWINELSSCKHSEIHNNIINYFEPIIRITYTKSNSL